MNKGFLRDWWYCDNILSHHGEVGLLHLGFPRVFLLMRDYDTAYFASYKEWAAKLLEINFLDPDDRKEYTGEKLDAILTDAWNFLCLEEKKEEEEYGELRDEDEFENNL